MAAGGNHAPDAGSPRIGRERKTVMAMIRIYCRAHHGSDGALCPDCEALHGYAMRRLDRCPFAPGKPTCANCPVHCYQREMRERIRQVMAFAGPRMLLKHPILAIRHLLDGRKRGGQAARRRLGRF